MLTCSLLATFDVKPWLIHIIYIYILGVIIIVETQLILPYNGGQVSILKPRVWHRLNGTLGGPNHLRQGDNSNDMHNGREARQRKGGQNKDDRILQKFMPPGEAM